MLLARFVQNFVVYTADLLFYYTIRAGITPARKIISLVIHCNIIISHISPDFSTHLHAAETYDNSKSIQSTDSLQLDIYINLIAVCSAFPSLFSEHQMRLFFLPLHHLFHILQLARLRSNLQNRFQEVLRAYGQNIRKHL